MFIILIINSRPRLTGATCFPLLGQLHGYVTPALPAEEHAWNWFRPYAHWQCTNKSTCLVHSALRGKASPEAWLQCQEEKWEHDCGATDASIFSFYVCEEMREGWLEEKKTNGGTSVERTHCLFWTHSTLWTATQRPWVYSEKRGMGQVEGMYSLSTGNSTSRPRA